MVRRSLVIAGVLAVALAALGAAVYGVMRPQVLRVAVSATGTDDLRVLAAMGQTLKRHGESLRIKVVPVQDPGAASDALERNDVDLAVVRSDHALPPSGQTVAILHRNAALLVALPGVDIPDVAGLEGHTVGILRGGAVNERLLDTVLRHYEIAPDRVLRVPLNPEDVASAVASKRVDALLVVAPVPSPLISGALAAIASVGRGPATFVPIDEAEAIALREPAFESMEVVRGAFGGTPARPADNLTTLAITYRLMAHADTSDMLVTNIARHLFEMRADLAHAVPQANRIEAPDTSKNARLPLHPGAAAYFDGDEETFMDRYGDWFYIVAMIVGFLGSAAAAVAGRLRSRQHDQAERLERLLRIMRETRCALDKATLERLEQEADDVFAETLSGASHSEIDTGRLAAFSLALDQVRIAIAERRRVLEEHAAAPAALPAQPPLRLAP